MYRQTLELRKKVLRNGHPSTLTSMANLTLVLSHQGKHKEAEEMHRQTLELQKKVLGSEHPGTLTSASNLAGVLGQQGKHMVNATQRSGDSSHLGRYSRLELEPRPSTQEKELSILGISSTLCESSSTMRPVYIVSFQCACGAIITDRYTELKSGGIAKLESDLRNKRLRGRHSFWRRLRGACSSMCLTVASDTSHGGQTGEVTRFVSDDASFPDKATSTDANSRPDIPTLHGNVQFAGNIWSQSNTSSYTSASSNTVLHSLLLCLPKYVTGFKLHHEVLPVNTVNNDRGMFQFLRQAHMKRRNLLSLRLGLRTVTKLSFTAFDVDCNNYVDLKPHLPTCTTTAAQNCVLPPPSVLRPPDPEYSYKPESPDYCPPRGPGYMTHYFQYPEEVHEQQRNILDQVPKHLRGQLPVTSNAPTRGWGLSFEEGLNYWPLVIAMLLPSLVFGVGWTILKRDIQGGFGVAAYCVSAEAVLFMYLLSPTMRT